LLPVTNPLPTPEELVAAGVWDPTAPEAEDQLRHLRTIAARGGTVEDMREATRRGTTGRLSAELLFLPASPRFTASELAERAGVAVGAVHELRRAFGLADLGDDDRRYTAGDLRVVQVVEAAAALFGRPATLQLLRVIGSAMSRVADATVSTFVTTIGAASGTDDDALLAANDAAMALYGGLVETMDTVLRHHLVHLARTDITEAQAGYESRDGAVGFVDVVGSTSLAQRLPLDEVGRAIGRFEAVAADAVTGGGGRVIKFVGDEVMYRSDDVVAAAEVALQLVEELQGDAVLPGVRAGVAGGVLLVRDGDCFGPVVNIAARAVKAAAPGAVVVASLGPLDPLPGLSTTPLPPRNLAGFEGPVALAEVRRP
jgi:class 3 adenylate cyclase